MHRYIVATREGNHNTGANTMSEYYSRLMLAVYHSTTETIDTDLQLLPDWYGLKIETVRHDAMAIYVMTSSAVMSHYSGVSAN